MDKSNSKNLRRMGSRAEHQDVAAVFQAYEYHKKNNNELQAELCLINCEAFLSSPESTLLLTEIKLIDFRRFSGFSMRLDPRLTVLIGDNGTGKTTVLDGIVKVLSWITSNIEKEGNIGKPVTAADINVSSSQYAEISADFTLAKYSRYSLSLSRAIVGANKKRDGNVREVKTLANLYRVVNAQYQINLPVFSFYSVDRSKLTSSTAKEKLDVAVPPLSSLDAYEDCFDTAGSFAKFLDFFAQLENLADPKSLTAEQVEEFQNLEGVLHKLVKLGSLSYDNPLWDIFNKKSSILASPPASLESKKHLAIVIKAIIGVIPNASELFLDRSSGRPELKIVVNDVTVNVMQLSHGQKSVIAMVADLVRRMILLNPKRENPLEGQGIVLIDEIELHLHPEWQQMILPNLLNMFPGVQFIVTTHSPQVVSTVNQKFIRILQSGSVEGGGLTASQAVMQTRGIASSDILAEIMGINPIPDVLEARELRDYRQLIEHNHYESDAAIHLRERLERHFGSNHPVIVECDRLIRLQEIKKKLPSRK